jgi:hypothetical protein
MASKKPLFIDMCAGSQLRDTQGEMLSVEGADISELEAGRGKLNDNHGKGFFNSIGRVTSAKKIFKVEDCTDPRHTYYWDKIKAPYIYVAGQLYDDEDHPNAKAAAAILRNIHKSDVPLQLKASVEGGVITRGIKDPTLLARTKIHSIALTFSPANNATLVEPISLEKSHYDEVADMLLIKSVLHLAETNVPSFRHIVRDASATKVQENILKINEILKKQDKNPIVVPSKDSIISQSLETKITNNILKIHDLVNLLNEGENMEKGWKNTIASAATAAALSATPQLETTKPVEHSQIKKPTQSIVQQDPKKDNFGSHPMDKFLWNIQQNESSGGNPDVQHPVIQTGVSKGDRAIGRWGLVKKTIDEMVNRMRLKGKLSPDAQKIQKMSRDQIADHFKNNPQSELNMARFLAQHVMNKQKGHEGRAAYSWLYGHNLQPTNISDEVLADDNYVQKYHAVNANNPFKKAKRSPAVTSSSKKKQIKQTPPLAINKALMAGYGGAGAPTNNVSGGVMQAESLEGSNPKFKFFSCDSCGDEQIYAPYQVKCRKCNTNLSLEKLHSILKKK